MLHHEYNTQKDEDMNNSVASYALKSKTYPLTNSLLVRIATAAGVHIRGYEEFLAAVFDGKGEGRKAFVRIHRRNEVHAPQGEM